MFPLLVVSSLLGVSAAIVCLPGFCDNIQQPVLDCKGGVIRNGGFCGCTDICAKVEGESCTQTAIWGVPNLDICDDGLVCAKTITHLEGHAVESHTCASATTVSQPTASAVPELLLSRREMKRAYQCETACQKKSLLCTFSFVIYEGQWFAKCDVLGNFLPEQCDNTNHCFCVDTFTGAIQDGTKVLGSASCY